ncbi:MAG: glycoside hydrolase family 25 protein [Pseudomonadales bacterium]|nr:glycoside hydrolase family 25 protein [Pseudomonadales bacterium]
MEKSEPYITQLIQYGLISKGFSLPKFGADGDWGHESQTAYDAYVADLNNETTVISNCVIDLSHHNTVSDFAAVKAFGIAAVIHKATQGLSYKDPEFQGRRSTAMAAGLLWAAYHFGTGDDAVTQAQHFLAQVQAGDLLVLDVENNPSGTSMTLEQACEFVCHVREQTGTWPGIYSSHYLNELLADTPDTLLSNCWLWCARYSSNEPVIPAAWERWTLWQYTDGAAGDEPQSVDGIGACDRDKFNGSLDELQQLWPRK